MIDRFQGFAFDPADLAEDVEIDPARRKEILFAEAKLARWTHWEALGIPWNAPVAAAKAAYIEKVKVFHPDRYAGKRIGSFRGRLERVFRRVTDARDALVDEATRAAYARETAPPEEILKLEARKLEDERRAEERRARLAKNNPLFARAGRVQELAKRGKAAFADGKFAAAANDLTLAASLDPKNAEIVALAAEARRKAGTGRANELFEKGLAAEVIGGWTSALERYREALESDPAHVRAAAHAARAAIAVGDVASARTLAEAAMKAGPRTGIAHEALGLVLDAEGSKRDAKKALEKALELDPRLETAKERLKKLRWSFLG